MIDILSPAAVTLNTRPEFAQRNKVISNNYVSDPYFSRRDKSFQKFQKYILKAPVVVATTYFNSVLAKKGMDG